MLHLINETVGIWDRLRQETRPVVLYGMGNGADKILAVCGQYGINISGVFASGGFIRGHSYRGFPVRTCAELEAELGELVVLLSFATALPEVLAQIESVARRHTLLAPDLPVSGDILFTREYLESNLEDARYAYSLLADEPSRQVFLDILNYKISGDIRYLRRCESPKDEVFRTILPLGEDEIFVDAGAYNGDTLEEFLRYTKGRFRAIYALEPDRRNFGKLQKNAERLGGEKIHCLQAGAWDRPATLHFAHRSGRQAALDEGGIPTAMLSIDSILDGGEATYIKYDVEGAEEKALLGSRYTIEKYAPALLVSAYHRSEDLFALPRLIRELNPAYRIYLRHHPYIPAWDTNLYAIPPQRGNHTESR